MTRLDDELKNALRRQEAPEDFADQVLARVAEQKLRQKPRHESWMTFFTQPLVRWAALAAVAAAMILGVIHMRTVERQHAEGEAAKQRLMLALHIAGSKLQLARVKVNEINTDQKQVKE
jgi:hypothetical protein